MSLQLGGWGGRGRAGLSDQIPAWLANDGKTEWKFCLSPAAITLPSTPEWCNDLPPHKALTQSFCCNMFRSVTLSCILAHKAGTTVYRIPTFRNSPLLSQVQVQAGEHLPEDLQLLNHFWRRTFNERLFLIVHLFIVEAYHILFLFLFYCISEIYKTVFFFSCSFYWFFRPLCLFASSALSILGALTPCCLYPLPRLTLPSTQMCLSSVTSWTYIGIQGTNININKFMLLEIVYYIHSAKQWRTRRRI